MSRNKFKNLIAFCLLMQSGKGILEKSPRYVEEKFKRYLNSGNEEFKWGLDFSNQIKFNKYYEKWKTLIYLLYEKN